MSVDGAVKDSGDEEYVRHVVYFKDDPENISFVYWTNKHGDLGRDDDYAFEDYWRDGSVRFRVWSTARNGLHRTSEDGPAFQCFYDNHTMTAYFTDNRLNRALEEGPAFTIEFKDGRSVSEFYIDGCFVKTLFSGDWSGHSVWKNVYESGNAINRVGMYTKTYSALSRGTYWTDRLGLGFDDSDSDDC